MSSAVKQQIDIVIELIGGYLAKSRCSKPLKRHVVTAPAKR
jgi:hypothetical protein